MLSQDEIAGAPIDLFPDMDPGAALSPEQINDFQYDFPEDHLTQERCPFAAHTRKMNPRADPGASAFPIMYRRIIRRGLQFGPEVTPEEAASGQTKLGRSVSCTLGTVYAGVLTFLDASMQGSHLRRVPEQHRQWLPVPPAKYASAPCFVSILSDSPHLGWANNTLFPHNVPHEKPVEPGFDAIVGQDSADIHSRWLSGTDPENQSARLSLTTEWVVPKGGEYFFSPSIPALKSVFAL